MTTGQITAAEQSLYANLVAEAIQIHGHDVYYLDRTLVAEDTVLGEDALSKFNTQVSYRNVYGRLWWRIRWRTRTDDPVWFSRT
jgi:hypothetical protein